METTVTDGGSVYYIYKVYTSEQKVETNWTSSVIVIFCVNINLIILIYQVEKLLL